MEESLEDLVNRIINNPSNKVPITVNELRKLQEASRVVYSNGIMSVCRLPYGFVGGICRYKVLVSP